MLQPVERAGGPAVPAWNLRVFWFRNFQQNLCDLRLMQRRREPAVRSFEGLNSKETRNMRSMSVAIGVALLAAGAISSARGTDVALEPNSDRVHVGSGVICDTQDEVTSFVHLMNENDP